MPKHTFASALHPLGTAHNEDQQITRSHTHLLSPNRDRSGNRWTQLAARRSPSCQGQEGRQTFAGPGLHKYSPSIIAQQLAQIFS